MKWSKKITYMVDGSELLAIIYIAIIVHNILQLTVAVLD